MALKEALFHVDNCKSCIKYSEEMQGEDFVKECLTDEYIRQIIINVQVQDYRESSCNGLESGIKFSIDLHYAIYIGMIKLDHVYPPQILLFIHFSF